MKEWEKRKSEAGVNSNSLFSKGYVVASGGGGEGKLAQSMKNRSRKEVRLEEKPSFVTTFSSYAGPPSVQVAKTTPFNTREPVMLACYVWGFYPADVTITWWKNGQLVLPQGSAQKIAQPNGDWTYQTLSHLATTPSFWDTYTCVVEHVGAAEPIRQDWSKGMAGRRIRAKAEPLQAGGGREQQYFGKGSEMGRGPWYTAEREMMRMRSGSEGMYGRFVTGDWARGYRNGKFSGVLVAMVVWVMWCACLRAGRKQDCSEKRMYISEPQIVMQYSRSPRFQLFCCQVRSGN